MTPKITSKPLSRLTIPELSGGVNYRDGISQVLDNQLTDCSNVWYKNGILRTRPGVRCAENNPHFESDCVPHSDAVTRRIYTNKNNFRVFDGTTYFLTVIQSVDGLDFRYYAEGKETLCNVNITSNELPQDDFTCNIFQHDADIYCFCSGYYEGLETPYYIFKVFEDDNKWTYKRIKDDDLYVPIVVANCETPAGMNLFEIGAALEMTGDYYEGYNMLGRYYKMLYSSVNKKLFEDALDGFSQAATYELLHPVTEGKKVKVEVDWRTSTEGPVNDIKHFVHEVMISDEEGWNYEKYDSNNPPEDGVYIGVSGRTLCFYICNQTDLTQKTFELSDFVDYNNMVITAPCPNDRANYEKVLNMTFSEWFGGGSEGIYDGTHLFIGGNSSESEKSLVCWSDFDKPLYFSENGYAYVGDRAQRVTAFGKQGESLIILKERETYATEYSGSGKPLDAEKIISGEAKSTDSLEITFPMVQVHGFIGCDCPKTVQLCRNRLVWAHSDGKLYTLVSANQWNERSIFEVSAMVERRLKSYSADALKGALSADWEGHYVLSLGDRFYLMDYNSYGYANVTSYSKNDDAQLHIPWWVWDNPKYKLNTYIHANRVEERRIESREEPVAISSMLTVGAKLYLWVDIAAKIGDLGGFYTPELLTFEGEDDMLPSIVVSGTGMTGAFKERNFSEKASQIPAMVQTKLFDFGQPTLLKRVPKAELSLGANGGVPIEVEVISGGSTIYQTVFADGEGDDEENPNYFSTAQLKGNGSPSRRIGYRLSASGRILLDSLAVYYKQLG